MVTYGCVLLLLISGVQSWSEPQCGIDYWPRYGSGMDRCEGRREYINGLIRDTRDPQRDGLDRLEGAVCCNATSRFRFYPTVINTVDWDFKANSWVMCPRGSFLKGFQRLGKNRRKLLDAIKVGLCMRPSNLPYSYGNCYDHHIEFNDDGAFQCMYDHFITGLHRGNVSQLYGIDIMKCCSMSPTQREVVSLESVKLKVMDESLEEIAYLSHYLGYLRTAGCRTKFVGEGFYRNGYTWTAENSKGCSSDNRLSIKYGDWKISMVEVIYGTPVITDLKPETVLTGDVMNEFCTESTNRIVQSSSVARSVTHTVTSSWEMAIKVGITIGYESLLTGLNGEARFDFEYETSSTTTDTEGDETEQIFTVDESVLVPGNTGMRWSMIISKTRRTLPYTARVIIRFSTELRGFLVDEGLPNNFHRDYQTGGSRNGESRNGGRRNVKYRFGSKHEPFYKALKRQSENFEHPWMWADLEGRYGTHITKLIQNLAYEGRYEFPLTGKFDDVFGSKVDLKHERIPLNGTGEPCGRAYRGAFKANSYRTYDSPVHKVVAKEGPGDTPVYPPPPVIDLNPVYDEYVPPAIYDTEQARQQGGAWGARAPPSAKKEKKKRKKKNKKEKRREKKKREKKGKKGRI